MAFNTKKCTVLSLTKKWNPQDYSYIMSRVTLTKVEQQTYLLFELTSRLSRTTNIHKITGKATRNLNHLHRNMNKAPQEIKSL